MESTTEQIAVTRELVIDASPETVWDLLVDPDKSSAWMGMQSWSEPTPGGGGSRSTAPRRESSCRFA